MIDFKFQKPQSGKTKFLDDIAKSALYKHKTLYVTNNYYDTKMKFKHYFKIWITNDKFEYVYRGFDGYSVFVFDEVKPPLDLLEHLIDNPEKFLFYRGTPDKPSSEFFNELEYAFFVNYFPEAII